MRPCAIPETLQLLDKDIGTKVSDTGLPLLGKIPFPTNEFRKLCYSEKVTRVIEEKLSSLRALYTYYAKGPKGETYMSYNDWLCFCNDLQLIDEHFTQREATLCYTLSRTHVLDEENEKTRKTITNHCFQDFCECLVRASLEMPFPTDLEIRRSGFPDAGTFLLDLKKDDSDYEQFRARHPECASSFDRPPQKPHRCVAHLISLLIRTVEGGTERGEDDATITKTEVAAFAVHGKQRAT